MRPLLRRWAYTRPPGRRREQTVTGGGGDRISQVRVCPSGQGRQDVPGRLAGGGSCPGGIGQVAGQCRAFSSTAMVPFVVVEFVYSPALTRTSSLPCLVMLPRLYTGHQSFLACLPAWLSSFLAHAKDPHARNPAAATRLKPLRPRPRPRRRRTAPASCPSGAPSSSCPSSAGPPCPPPGRPGRRPACPGPCT